MLLGVTPGARNTSGECLASGHSWRFQRYPFVIIKTQASRYEAALVVHFPNVYQDGAAVVEDELSFYHSTNECLINSILANGVQGSVHFHEADGLWVFSLLAPATYDWAMSPLQYWGGYVLHLKVPVSLCSNDGETILRQNNKIRGDSERAGHR